jgi:hypothetical protein
MNGIVTLSSNEPQEPAAGQAPVAQRSASPVDRTKLPQFIIIGAAKAATTWLSTVLRQQPGVFMPEPELHYYNRNYDKGLGWYARNFDAALAGQVIGEKSASYLADAEVPGRIKQALPKARLIVQLRNPVERAYSDYCMLLRRGEVGGDVARYLDTDRTPMRRFLDHGLYALHLANFLDVFPRERIKILLYDDIAQDPNGVFVDVARFLDLVDAVPPEQAARRVKDKDAAMLPLSLRRLLRPVKAAARPWRDQPVFQKARGLLAKPMRYPPLDEATRRRMAAFYTDDVRALEDLIDRKLDGWLRPADRVA